MSVRHITLSTLANHHILADTFPWSVCLFVYHGHALCSNGKRYRHDFLHTTPRLSHIALHRSTLPPQILPKNDTPHVDLSVRDIRRQIATDWPKIAQWSQW